MPRQAEADKKNERGGRRRATSYDVAKLAGVSQSAVSRVFQSGASASADMRERVLNAANQLGYRPNAIARGLITQRSNMVAVVISRQTNLYYPEVLVQLTQRFSEHGIRVLLFTLEHEADTQGAIDQMLQYQVDGVVVAAMLSAPHIEILHNAQIPIVLYNRAEPATEVNAVRCDQEEGERWLVSELVAAGHTEFCIVSGPDDSPVSAERTGGALQTLKELGFDNVPVIGGDYGYESGRAAMATIVAQRGAAPGAIIAANDAMAIGCIDEARERFGLSVPGDLSVVGFDGVGPARFAAYRLCTVRQPVGRMTSAAVSMLVERIDNPDVPPEKRVFSGERVRGGSARLPPE